MCRRIPCIGIDINKKRRNLIVAVLRLKALALPIYAEWQRAEPTLIYVKYVQPLFTKPCTRYYISTGIYRCSILDIDI